MKNVFGRTGNMNLTCDVIVDGKYLVLRKGIIEDCGIMLKEPWARMSDGAVRPSDMSEALKRIKAAGKYSIGYRKQKM